MLKIKKNFEYIDIILPVYNAENYIIKTINSIIKQSYKFWKLYILDDGSTDNTYKLLNNYINKNNNNRFIFLYKNLKNKGQGYSRNFLLSKARSNFLAFIDSDDIWKKHKLKKQLFFMRENNVDFSYTDYMIFKKNKKKNIITPKKFNFENFIKNTSIATSTIMLRKKIINNHVRFLKAKFCEDYFFKCQLLKKYEAIKCPGRLTNYRLVSTSLQSNRLKTLYWVWFINKKYNRLNIFKNLVSILLISFNSYRKYGFR
jgi:teichuronic acid biosynthesis glycosyltransferase TuaG